MLKNTIFVIGVRIVFSVESFNFVVLIMQKKEKDSKHEGLGQMWRAFSLLSGIGIYLIVVVLICLYLGGLADEYLNLGGKGRLIGIILGFPVAFYSIYRQLKSGKII